MNIPQLILNNGVQIPALGFGVFQTPPEATIAAVEAALATGYRHIDTAAAYGNERQVGEAIRRSGLDRSEVFMETKLWISDYGYDQTLHGFDKSAGKLGLRDRWWGGRWCGRGGSGSRGGCWPSGSPGDVRRSRTAAVPRAGSSGVCRRWRCGWSGWLGRR
jgi:hypothetical protein